MSTPQDPFASPSPDQGGSPPPPPAAPTWGAPPPAGAAQPSGWGSAPGSPGYDASGYGGAPRGASNGAGTAALVLGILGLLTSWLVVGGLLGLVAIVLGAVALGKVRKGEASNRGAAVAGIVLGVLSVVVAGLALALGAYFFNSDEGQQFTDCVVEAAGDPEAEAECQREFEDSLGG